MISKSLTRHIKNTDYFVIKLFLVWRILLFSASSIGIVLLPYNHGFPYWDTILARSGLPQWLWQWGSFDGVHYLMIANGGYDGFGTQVFFPLYPLTIRLFNFLIPNLLISALLVSHVAFLLGAIIFYRLVAKDFGQKVARWSLLFLFFFPTSFYFASVYTESLFLLLISSSFFFSAVTGGVLSALSGATRLVGLFIVPAKILFKPRNWWSLLGLSGIVLYCTFLFFRFGNPLLFISAQSAFNNNRSSSVQNLVNPFQVVYRYLKIFITVNPYNYFFWVAVGEFGAFALGFSVLLWLTLKKKVSFQYLFFGWVAFLLPTLSGTLSSFPRYLLVNFPVIIGLGMLQNHKIKLAILTVFVLLLGLLTALFGRGYWVS